MEDRQKNSDLTYEFSLLKRQKPHLIDCFMPNLRECALNRYTLQEMDAYLRNLGYGGLFGAVRYLSPSTEGREGPAR